MIWLESFFFSFMKEKFIFPSCTPTKETSTANLLGRVQIQTNHKPGVLDLFGNLIRTCFFFFFTLVRKQVHMLRGVMLSVREIRKVFNWKISGSFLSWVHGQINWVCKALNQHENISTIVKISCFNQRLLSLVSVTLSFSSFVN